MQKIWKAVWDTLKIKQLDGDVSPPDIITGLPQNFRNKIPFFLYFPGYELFYSHLSFGPVTDRQKVMHVSPPCISTVVLKKYRPSQFPSKCEAQVGSKNWNEQEWPLHFGCL